MPAHSTRPKLLPNETGLRRLAHDAKLRTARLANCEYGLKLVGSGANLNHSRTFKRFAKILSGQVLIVCKINSHEPDESILCRGLYLQHCHFGRIVVGRSISF